MSGGYSGVFPTVTISTCSSGTNCAIGGSCTATSQCVTGSCCGFLNNSNTTASQEAFSYYYNNQEAWVARNGSTVATTQAAYNALFSARYLSNKYCMSSANGASTVTYYNSTLDQGAYVPSTNTSTYNIYNCNNQVIYNPNYSPNQEYVPTVTASNCTTGSNCPTGSICSSQSQCAAGNCCGYVNQNITYEIMAEISKYFDQFTNINDTYRVTSNNQTLQTVMNLYYQPTRYCLSNVDGSSTTSSYNSSRSTGAYYNSTSTNKLEVSVYTCQLEFGYQSKSALVLETIQALILAAFSFAYLQLS